MKNLITNFNVFVNEKYNFVIGDVNNIYEAEESLSDLSSRMGFFGASASNTTNVTALKAVSDSFPGIYSKAKEGGLFKKSMLSLKMDIKEGNALYMNIATGKSEVKPKSSNKSTDYIKLGGKIWLDGDTGKPVYEETTFSNLSKFEIEASGNGIFAMSRFMKARALGMIGDKTQVYIGLDLKSTDAFVAEAKTGVQSSIGGFTDSIIMAMISAKVIVPHEGNTLSFVKAGKNKINDSDFIKNILGIHAVPSISEVDGAQKRKNLQQSEGNDRLDLTEGIKKYKNKEITRDVASANKIFDSLVDTYYAPYIEVTCNRFRKYFDMTASDLGVPTDLFKKIKSDVDNYENIAKDKSKIEEYKKFAHKRLEEVFAAVKDKGGVLLKGASTNVSKVKGSEGKI